MGLFTELLPVQRRHSGRRCLPLWRLRVWVVVSSARLTDFPRRQANSAMLKCFHQRPGYPSSAVRKTTELVREFRQHLGRNCFEQVMIFREDLLPIIPKPSFGTVSGFRNCIDTRNLLSLDTSIGGGVSHTKPSTYGPSAC